MKLYSVLLVILTALFSTSFNSSAEFDIVKIPSDSIKTITLSFVGDLMCHVPQMDYARAGNDSFDFRPVFRFIQSHLSSSDFTAGNLETVTAGSKSGFTGYPLFNSPDEYVYALSFAGFDFLFTSNNHSLDRSEKGVLKTIDVLDKYGLRHTGTFSSAALRDSIQLISLSGISSVFLSYSYGTNGNPLPKGKEYLINLIDTTLIKRDIHKARSYNPDLVIVYFHFGEEYKREPSYFQEIVAEKAAQYGADLIIGSHPHVVQPVTFFKGNHKLDSVFTAFSLGNFLSNQRDRYRDGGVILNVKISKNFTRDSIYFSGYSFVPTWVYKGNTGLKREFLIFPEDSSMKYPTFLSPEDLRRMKQSYSDTRAAILNEKPSEY